MREVFVCAGVRTPIGRYGGALASVRTDDLAAIPLKELAERLPSLDWEGLDDVILGCANQAGEDNRNVARMAVLLAGLGETVPATTINRLCGSGLDALATGAARIRSGEADLIVVGGVESMSRAPFVMGKADKPFARGQVLEDTTLGWRFVNPKMKAEYGVDPMAQTAENVAEAYGISREDQDAFALGSQQRAAAAQASGRLAREIVPVEMDDRRGKTVLFDRDEHPRATSLEALAKLPPIVRADGTVTAGNASGINDGAAALVLASEEGVRRNHLEPLARVLGSAVAGVAPRVMGIGPVPATRKLLARLEMSIAEFDVVELNEAFASQALATLRELGLADDAEHVNPNGGAIALGHPLGMSGTRLALTLAQELKLCGARYGLCTMCIGVGQGIAIAFERDG